MPLLAEFLGAVARWLLALAAGSLITHHILTADQADRFSSAIVEHLMMAVPLLVPLLWSLWAKYKNRIKFLTALEVPAGFSEKKLDAIIKNGNGASL